MDEVGRGTGTLDGVSIAWAVSEYLLDRIGCRTLFATHYHELTSMENPHLVNLSMAVLENQGEIVFLKQLVNGPAAGSYGIHVAGLAGIPQEVLNNARSLQSKMVHFEQSLTKAQPQPRDLDVPHGLDVAEAKSVRAGTSAHVSTSTELFSPEDLALAKIRSADIDRMTPLQALELLADVSEMLKQST